MDSFIARSFPGELKVTNSALGLPAKHPLLFAALSKVDHHKDGDLGDFGDHDHDLLILGLFAKDPPAPPFAALNMTMTVVMIMVIMIEMMMNLVIMMWCPFYFWQGTPASLQRPTS